jgi:hypothetical protein
MMVANAKMFFYRHEKMYLKMENGVVSCYFFQLCDGWKVLSVYYFEILALSHVSDFKAMDNNFTFIGSVIQKEVIP